MTSTSRPPLTLLLVMIVVTAACGGDSAPSLDASDADLSGVPDTTPDADVDVNPRCPVARASAGLARYGSYRSHVEAEAQSVVFLDGSRSTSPDGHALGYKWTLVSHPNGAPNHLITDDTPRIFVDVIGTYEVELEVFDEHGTTSCDKALVTIDVVPTSEVHIELVWDTPGDPDQSDYDGTDLDLHYRHPRGIWNSAPWDVFFRNPRGDWGEPENPDDDPRLYDDIDGVGPESISHSQLDEVSYAIGVHYYNDGDFGPSDATVRVYVDRELVFEQERRLESTGTFWEVGVLAWPSGEVVSVDQIHEGFPEEAGD